MFLSKRRRQRRFAATNRYFGPFFGHVSSGQDYELGDVYKTYIGYLIRREALEDRSASIIWNRMEYGIRI